MFKIEVENFLKICKSKMAAASDVIMLLWLPWKPIKQRVVSIKLKVQRMLIIRSKYLINRMKAVKSKGKGSINPPVPLMPSCNFF